MNPVAADPLSIRPGFRSLLYMLGDGRHSRLARCFELLREDRDSHYITLCYMQHDTLDLL